MLLKRLIIFINIIVISTFVWMGQKQYTFQVDGATPTLPLVSYQAPEFSLETFDGEVISFKEDLLGKPLLINFWASWCPPCRAEMPALVEVAHLYENEVNFIGINVATQDGMNQALQFVEEFEVPYANLIDENATISRKYQVPPIPTTLVVDKNGTVVYRKVGGMTKSEMVAAVRQGLDGGNLNAK